MSVCRAPKKFQNDPVDYKVCSVLAFQVARIVRSICGCAGLTELAHLTCHEICLLPDGLLRDFALLRKGDKDLLSGWLRYGLHVRSNIGCEIQIEWQEQHQKDGFQANRGHARRYKTKRERELRGSERSSRTYLHHMADYTRLHSP